MVDIMLIRFPPYQMKTIGGVGALKFLAEYGPVLTKIAKCNKRFNFEGIAKENNSLYFNHD